MATIGKTGEWLSKGIHKTTWANLSNGDDGSPQDAAGLSDRSIQVKGTFGSGGQVDIEGSNDGGTTWHILNDPQGNALSITAAKVEAVLEYVDQIRPNVSAGDTNTDLTVVLVGRGQLA